MDTDINYNGNSNRLQEKKHNRVMKLTSSTHKSEISETCHLTSIEQLDFSQREPETHFLLRTRRIKKLVSCVCIQKVIKKGTSL